MGLLLGGTFGPSLRAGLRETKFFQSCSLIDLENLKIAEQVANLSECLTINIKKQVIRNKFKYHLIIYFAFSMEGVTNVFLIFDKTIFTFLLVHKIL